MLEVQPVQSPTLTQIHRQHFGRCRVAALRETSCCSSCFTERVSLSHGAGWSQRKR